MGRCRAAFQRWWYNRRTNQCERFIYGGCGGNQNNFETRDECERQCVRRQNTCKLFFLEKWGGVFQVQHITKPVKPEGFDGLFDVCHSFSIIYILHFLLLFGKSILKLPGSFKLRKFGSTCLLYL